jgi:membrane protease YdiL (CAAX protease family)
MKTGRRNVFVYLELGLVFLATLAAAQGLAVWSLSFITDPALRPLVSWISHVPQLLVPWLWYQFRLRPQLPSAERSLWRWPAGGARPFLLILVIVVGLKFAGSLVEALTSGTPEWLKHGPLTVLLILGFQGIFVGLSEEMLFRQAIHLPLRMRLEGAICLWRVRLSWANIITAFGFGLFHLGNLFLGQSLAVTLAQATMAMVLALIFGIYYDRTKSYLGVAVLHNLFDVCSYVAILLVAHR